MTKYQLNHSVHHIERAMCVLMISGTRSIANASTLSLCKMYKEMDCSILSYRIFWRALKPPQPII